MIGRGSRRNMCYETSCYTTKNQHNKYPECIQQPGAPSHPNQHQHQHQHQNQHQYQHQHQHQDHSPELPPEPWTETASRMLKTMKQALFSADLQMPNWSPVQTVAADYEIRQYEPAKWVSTVVSAMEWDPAISTGFMRLFSYIQGNNEKKVKIEMTAPVTCFVNPGSGPFCESGITVSFFIPPEFQSDPPKPSESNVYIENRSALTVCVRTFGGFTNAAKNQEQLLELGASLKRDGRIFDERVYYTAGYDSPFKIFNRCNEVWLIKIN